MAGSPPAGLVAGRLAAAAAARAGLGERAAPGAGRTVAAVLGACVLREFLRAGHAVARASGLAGTRTARNALACRRLPRALRHLPIAPRRRVAGPSPSHHLLSRRRPGSPPPRMPNPSFP